MWIRWAKWSLLCTVLGAAVPWDVRWSQQVQQKEAQLQNARKSSHPFNSTNLLGSSWDASDRIQRVVIVDSYQLQIEPFFPFRGVPADDRQDFTFDGKVKIIFKVTQDTEFVHFRAEELYVESVVLRHEDIVEPIYLMQMNAQTTEVRLQGLRRFVVGEVYELEVEYWGKINQYNGIYANSYEINGEKRYALTTQLETISARKVFPGFDDPWFKAAFNFSLIHPTAAKVFSNNRNIQTLKHGEKSITTFAETPRMSSYLFAFAVGEFTSASAMSKRGIEVRVNSLPPSAHAVTYWSRVCAQCLDAMEEMTGVEYPLAKLDNINMAKRGGAMENWGMIVYSDILSKSPLWASDSQLHDGKMYACHEISHQWFGNLVTADHWGLEFLHESFANFFESRAIGHFANPELEELDFTKERGLNSAAAATHPVIADRAYFDGVTYTSGAGILRMLNAVIGDEKFYAALKAFLERHQYSTTDHLGLIEKFEEALNYNPLCGDLQVREFLLDFLLQVHYPIVDIDHDGEAYKITARPFKAGTTSKWNIPIFVENPKDKSEQLIWLLKDGSLCGAEALDPKTLYLFHRHGSTFARIHYSDAFWERIQSEVNFANVNEQTLYAMVDDRVDQEKRDLDAKPLLLQLRKKIVESTDGHIHPIFIEAYFRLDAADQSKAIVDKIVKRVNYEPKTDLEVMFTEIVGSRGIQPNLGTNRSRAVLKFRQLMRDCKDLADIKTCNKIRVEARAAIYCSGALQRDRTAKDFFNKYKAAVENIPEARAEFDRLETATKCAGQK